MNRLLDTLRHITGEENVLTGEGLVAFERDWRGREHGKALCVVRPAHTAEVSALVKACAAAGVAMVPQGGNTGLVMGSTPDTSGQEVVVSLQRMNKVRHIDVANATLTAEAGCILQQLQQTADQAGFLFALSLASEGSCTLGGNLASNAGGTQVLRYGNTRDLCLGLEVVTAQGDVWQGLSGLRKDNTGYDLRHLMIGSEGTLGVITAATLKLFPQPAATLTAWAAVPSVAAAVQLLGLAHQHLGPGLTGFEMMGRYALSLVDHHYPQLRVPLWQDHAFCVLLENADTESEAHARARFEHLLEVALESGCVADAVVAENLSQAHNFWHIRESITMAQADEGPNIKHDISVPVSAMVAFVAEAEAALQAAVPGIRLVNFGHLGDGNLHFNVQGPASMAPMAFIDAHEAQVNAIVYERVRAHGGSISAEHGVGSMKAGMLPQFKDPTALALMRQVKQALDPKGILNPGRVVG